MKSLKPVIPIVRAFGQFGPIPKDPSSIRLFLDDARNPPLKERGWVVVRTVADAIVFMREHGHLVTECSLDNDLGPDPQGYQFLERLLILHDYKPFPQLRQITIHTGNLPKWRLMMRMLRKTDLKAVRRIPHDRIYPRASHDTRNIEIFTYAN